MNRLRFIFVVATIFALPWALVACGGGDPDPTTILDRALTRTKLAEFGNTPGGNGQSVVAVQSLGYEDRVLGERLVEAQPQVISELREALGSGNGIRRLAKDLEYEGDVEVNGVETEQISGQLDVGGMVEALEQSGGAEVGSLAGLDGKADLESTLSNAEFDLYAGDDDGVIRRLDLTLAFDDPDNALPPTRIRFSLTTEPARRNA